MSCFYPKNIYELEIWHERTRPLIYISWYTLSKDVSDISCHRIFYRWLGVTMETLGGVVTFFATLFVVLQRDTLTGGLAGLSISYALNVIHVLYCP